MVDAISMVFWGSIGAVIGVSLFVAAGVALRVRALRPFRQARNRGLYAFHDGKTIRYIDPILALRAITLHPTFNWEIHAKQASMNIQEGIDAICEVVQHAFGVVPYTAIGKPGLTEMEMLNLFSDFAMFCDVQKKNLQRSATSADYTAAMSSEFASETTSNTSDFGSISNEPQPSNP